MAEKKTWTQELTLDALAAAAGGSAEAGSGIRCPVCGKRFASAAEFEKHAGTAHPDLADYLQTLQELIRQLLQQARETEIGTTGK